MRLDIPCQDPQNRHHTAQLDAFRLQMPTEVSEGVSDASDGSFESHAVREVSGERKSTGGHGAEADQFCAGDQVSHERWEDGRRNDRWVTVGVQ